MSLLDNVRQTLGEAASTAREVGQNLSSQAQSQLNIKKLQLEHAKKLRDLGEKAYNWYQTGQMVVTGTVPADVRTLCQELDESSTRLRLEEAKLEEARLQAAARVQNKDEQPSTYSVLPEDNVEQTSVSTSTNTPMTNNNPMTDTASSHVPHSAHPTHTAHAEGGVVMPGTGIVTNPTPPSPDPQTTPAAVPAANVPPVHGTNPPSDLAEGDAPVVPVGDLAPSPQGDITIGGGTMPGAPGTSDTMGGGLGGGGVGGATM